jgi:uncharacterized RDD family membrane protein YckC
MKCSWVGWSVSISGRLQGLENDASLLPIFGLLVVLELGPWNWLRQLIWPGKKAVTLTDVFGAIPAQIGYRRADIAEGRYI